jgi:hypothetical protein
MIRKGEEPTSPLEAVRTAGCLLSTPQPSHATISPATAGVPFFTP